jgi:hypothetical protein
MWEAEPGGQLGNGAPGGAAGDQDDLHARGCHKRHGIADNISKDAVRIDERAADVAGEETRSRQRLVHAQHARFD